MRIYIRSQVSKFNNDDNDIIKYRLYQREGAYAPTSNGKGRFLGVIPLSYVPDFRNTSLPKWMYFDDGWNGSYHDAWYYEDCRMVVVVARSQARARRRMRAAKKIIEQCVIRDTAQMRFEARRQVREGD